jgi:hypothetical protein
LPHEAIIPAHVITLPSPALGSGQTHQGSQSGKESQLISAWCWEIRGARYSSQAQEESNLPMGGIEPPEPGRNIFPPSPRVAPHGLSPFANPGASAPSLPLDQPTQGPPTPYSLLRPTRWVRVHEPACAMLFQFKTGLVPGAPACVASPISILWSVLQEARLTSQPLPHAQGMRSRTRPGHFVGPVSSPRKQP